MKMMIKRKKKWTKILVKKDLSKSQEINSQLNSDAEKARDHKQLPMKPSHRFQL